MPRARAVKLAPWATHSTMPMTATVAAEASRTASARRPRGPAAACEAARPTRAGISPLVTRGRPGARSAAKLPASAMATSHSRPKRSTGERCQCGPERPSQARTVSVTKAATAMDIAAIDHGSTAT